MLTPAWQVGQKEMHVGTLSLPLGAEELGGGLEQDRLYSHCPEHSNALESQGCDRGDRKQLAPSSRPTAQQASSLEVEEPL